MGQTLADSMCDSAQDGSDLPWLDLCSNFDLCGYDSTQPEIAQLDLADSSWLDVATQLV